MLTVDFDLLDLQPGHRILDLGCGAGQLAHHLAAAGAARVVAVLQVAATTRTIVAATHDPALIACATSRMVMV